jgi:hypothetical protein
MAKPVKGAAVGVDERADRIGMQYTDVIAFEKRINSQLPINPPLQNPGLVVVEGVETVRREVGCKAVQKAIDIECRLRRRADPDHAVFLDDGQRPQAARRSVKFGEGAFVRRRYQCPVEAVGPAVIGAGEAVGIPAAALRDARAAVPADVQRGSQQAIRLPDQRIGTPV